MPLAQMVEEGMEFRILGLTLRAQLQEGFRAVSFCFCKFER